MDDARPAFLPHPTLGHTPAHTERVLLPDPLPPYITGGSVNLVIGNQRAGKTRLLAYLLRRWYAGLPILGAQPQVVPAHGFLSASRSFQRTVAPQMAGLPLRTFCLVDNAGFDFALLKKKGARVEALERCLNHLDLPRGSVLWVDPLLLFLGGSPMDFDGCALACLEIRKVLAARGLTLVGTMLSAKSKGDDQELYPRLVDRIVGTVSQLAFADSALYLATPDELKKAGVYTLQAITGDTPVVEHALVLTAAGTFEDAPAGAEFEPVLSLVPADGTPVRVSDLRRILVPRVMSRATLFRALKVLLDQAVLHKPEYGAVARSPQH